MAEKIERSLQEKVQVDCPLCQRSFTTSRWVIIDVDEFPRLANHCATGAVYEWQCPCGHSFYHEYPFLYHDPDHEILIFVRPPHLSLAAVREMNKRFMDHLTEFLPDSDTLGYLQTTLVVPSLLGLKCRLKGLDALAACQRWQKNPLWPVTWEYLNSPTWLETQKILEKHPELIDEEEEAFLAELIALGQDIGDDTEFLEQHLAFLRDCRQNGLEQAVRHKLLPEDRTGSSRAEEFFLIDNIPAESETPHGQD